MTDELTVEEIDEWIDELTINERGSETTVMTRQWALRLLAAARQWIEARPKIDRLYDLVVHRRDGDNTAGNSNRVRDAWDNGYRAAIWAAAKEVENSKTTSDQEWFIATINGLAAAIRSLTQPTGEGEGEWEADAHTEILAKLEAAERDFPKYVREYTETFREPHRRPGG